MYTPKSSKSSRVSQESFLDSSPESPPSQLLSKLGVRQVPSLRLAQTDQRCLNCAQFMYAAGRAHSGDGECSMHRTPVREDFVCDGWEDVNGDEE